MRKAGVFERADKDKRKGLHSLRLCGKLRILESNGEKEGRHSLPWKENKISQYESGTLDLALKGKRKNLLVDDIIDKPSLAVYLNQTEETITSWQKEYGLPFISIGRQTFFSIKSIYEWLMEKEQTLFSEKELKKRQRVKGRRGRSNEKFDPSLEASRVKSSEILSKPTEIF